MGEMGERDTCFEAEAFWEALVGDDRGGPEAGVQVKRAGGGEAEVGSEDEQGGADGDVSGGKETGREVMGNISPEGDGENWSELTGATGGRSGLAADRWCGDGESGGLEVDAASALGASGEAVLVGEAGSPEFGSLARGARLVGEADGTFLPASGGTVCGFRPRRAVS